MKGNILDFLKFAVENPDLAKELSKLAERHGFEFTDEVTDEQLERIAGGLNVMPAQTSTEPRSALRTIDQPNISGSGTPYGGSHYVDSTDHTVDSTGYTQPFNGDRN